MADVLNDVVITKAGPVAHHRAGGADRRLVRVGLPRRRPHRVLPHRLHRLQPRRGRAHPAPRARGHRAHPHLPPHAHEPPAGGGRVVHHRGDAQRRPRGRGLHRLRRPAELRPRGRRPGDHHREPAPPPSREGAGTRLLRGPAHQAQVGGTTRRKLPSGPWSFRRALAIPAPLSFLAPPFASTPPKPAEARPHRFFLKPELRFYRSGGPSRITSVGSEGGTRLTDSRSASPPSFPTATRRSGPPESLKS